MAGKIVLNKSFLYLFPIIYKELVEELELDYKIFLKEDFMTTIVNCYCFVESNNQFAITFTITDKTQSIIDIFSKSKNFILVDNNEIDFTMIFKISTGVKECYDKFISGKYSKYSEADKTNIIKFVKELLVHPNVPESIKLLESVGQVLNKSKNRVKMMMDMFGLSEDDWNPEWEVSSIINVDNENYKLYGGK